MLIKYDRKWIYIDSNKNVFVSRLSGCSASWEPNQDDRINELLLTAVHKNNECAVFNRRQLIIQFSQDPHLPRLSHEVIDPRWGDSPIKAVAIDEESILVLTERGHLYCAGEYQIGAQHFPDLYNDFIFNPVAQSIWNNDAIKLLKSSLTGNMNYIVTSTGHLFVRGANDLGQLGMGQAELVAEFTEINNLPWAGDNIKFIAGSGVNEHIAYSIIVTETNQVFQAGTDGLNPATNRFTELSNLPWNDRNITSIAVTESGVYIVIDHIELYVRDEADNNQHPNFVRADDAPWHSPRQTQINVQEIDLIPFVTTTTGQIYTLPIEGLPLPFLGSLLIDEWLQIVLPTLDIMPHKPFGYYPYRPTHTLEPANHTTLANLPNEILQAIFGSLTVGDIFNLLRAGFLAFDQVRFERQSQYTKPLLASTLYTILSNQFPNLRSWLFMLKDLYEKQPPAKKSTWLQLIKQTPLVCTKTTVKLPTTLANFNTSIDTQYLATLANQLFFIPSNKQTIGSVVKLDSVDSHSIFYLKNVGLLCDLDRDRNLYAANHHTGFVFKKTSLRISFSSYAINYGTKCVVSPCGNYFIAAMHTYERGRASADGNFWHTTDKVLVRVYSIKILLMAIKQRNSTIKAVGEGYFEKPRTYSHATEYTESLRYVWQLLYDAKTQSITIYEISPVDESTTILLTMKLSQTSSAYYAVRQTDGKV